MENSGPRFSTEAIMMPFPHQESRTVPEVMFPTAQNLTICFPGKRKKPEPPLIRNSTAALRLYYNGSTNTGA